MMTTTLLMAVYPGQLEWAVTRKIFAPYLCGASDKTPYLCGDSSL